MRLAGDPPDVMVSPRVGRVNLFEFHRAADIIALGAEAAEKSIDAIQESDRRADVRGGAPSREPG